jgi:formylmethanofuran dehydrogenase subunit C
MAGGRIRIEGNCGDFAAASLPGSMDGMRGGSLTILGNVGERLADRMRRGTVLVCGNTGDYAASRMVAGTLALAGSCGAHLAYGMRRGTVLCLGDHPEPSSTFAATSHDIGVYWALLRRHLAQAGGAFADLPAAAPRRYVGDIAADGKGELLWFD